MPDTSSRFDADDVLYVAHKWRSLLNSPDATDADRARFEAWIDADPRHADVFGQAVTFWEAFGHVSQSDLDPETLKPVVRERIAHFVGAVAAVAATPAVRVARAAAVGLVIVGAVVLNGVGAPRMAAAPVVAAYSTAKGAVKSVALNDGSTITMGPETSLEATYSANARRIRLTTGAAYFDVARDAARPFSVEAGDLEVVALGTAFDVRGGDRVWRVAVAEGAVDVAYPPATDGATDETLGAQATSRNLSAGEQIAATRTRGLSEVSPIAPVDVGAWRSGRLFYDGASLREVVSDLNRYSETPIMIDDGGEGIADLRLRGGFRADDIDGLLNATAFIHPVTIDRSDPDVVVIRAR
ncbi:MAG: FecR domain-containing protein [Pseudomonadota bacterium]